MDIKINTKITEKQRNTTNIIQLSTNRTLTQQTKIIEKWINNNPIFSGIDLRGAVIDSTESTFDNTIISFTLRLFSEHKQKQPNINIVLPEEVMELLNSHKFMSSPCTVAANKLTFNFNISNGQAYLDKMSLRTPGYWADGVHIEYLKSAYDGKIYVNFKFNKLENMVFIRDNKILFSDIKDSTGKRERKLFYPAGNKCLLFVQSSYLSPHERYSPQNNPAFLEYAKSGKITRNIFKDYSRVVKEYQYAKHTKDKLMRTLTNNINYANPSKLINNLDDGYSIRQFKRSESEPFDTQKNWLKESRIMPTKTANKPINKWTLNDLIDSGVTNVDLRADILTQIKNQKPASMGKIIDYNPAQGWLIKPNKWINTEKPMLLLLLICPTKKNRYLHFVPENVNTGQFSTPEYYNIDTVEKARRLMMFDINSNAFYKVISAGLMDVVPAIIES